MKERIQLMEAQAILRASMLFNIVSFIAMASLLTIMFWGKG